MAKEIIVEWKYEPEDYFEDDVIISSQNYKMNIANGFIKAKVNPKLFYSSKDLISELHDKIEIKFFEVEVITHKPFTLSKLPRHFERS